MNPRALLLLAATIALSACGGSAPPPAPSADAARPAEPTKPAESAKPAEAEEKVLNVYNWSDYVAPDTIERFSKETGIKVVYDVYDKNETLDAKLTTGGSGYDLVFPTVRPFAQRHIRQKLYRELDKTKLGNWGNLDPANLAGVADADPGNAHLMPYMWGTTGIGYNVAAIRKRLGDNATIDSWSVLFDPKTAAKLKDCGIALLDDEQEGFYAALIYLGRDPNATNPENLEATRKLFAGIRPFVRYFNSSKYIDDLANGEICIAMGYSGDVVQARNRAAEAANGVQIGFAIPKEGATRSMDSAAIPADAPHPGNAHQFINFLLRPDVIAPISNTVGYANCNAKARDLVDEKVRNDPGIYPPAEVLAKLVDPKTLADDDSRQRVRAWTTITSGQ